MIDLAMQRMATMVGPTGTQEGGGTIAFDRATMSFQGAELTGSAVGQVLRFVRVGSTGDAVAAGDLVMERFLTSLRKLAEH